MGRRSKAEVEVPRRVAWAVAALFALVVVTALGLLGRANSPRDGEGRPLLLTPERRAILRYLEAAGEWVDRLAAAGERLDALTPAGPGAPEETPDPPPTPAAGMEAPGQESGALLVPPDPEAQPADLYRRAHEAQAARSALEDLAREVERAQVPEALVGLHAAAAGAVEAHLAWDDGVLAWIGAPASVDPEELAALRDEARDALADLEEALATHASPTTHGVCNQTTENLYHKDTKGTKDTKVSLCSLCLGAFVVNPSVAVENGAVELAVAGGSGE